MRKLALCVLSAFLFSLGLIAPAQATPVCTDGYMGGPPLAACGGRVFPEVENSVDYVQYLPQPGTGFREYQHGLEKLADENDPNMYSRWLDVFTLSGRYDDPDAVSAGPDRRRSTAANDTGDGYEILVVKMTDETVPDEGKETLLFSLSVHGDEKGGIEGGVRAIEDLAMAAKNGGTISDGVAGYESTTGSEPEFHTYQVAEVLKNEVVYFVDFNIDGWAAGDVFSTDTQPLYTRGNFMGTDLNRQMPTVGRIDPSRNPLQEPEMNFGHRLMHEVAEDGIGGRMAYGADIHGESQSRAWVDIMYPAGQFDSVKHRRLMSIAERTKSLIDDTLFFGIPDMIEEETGGDAGEGIEDLFPEPVHSSIDNTIPTKPARWGTVWDTLGYTDTGFIGDYMAEELGVTGMDYEIAFNHADLTRPFGRPWSVLLQENYVNASRAIIKTAMAYAMTARQEFSDFRIQPGGRVGYIYNPEVVTNTDANGVGRLPGPSANGIGADGQPVQQRPYSATPMAFFEDEAQYVEGGFRRLLPYDIAMYPRLLDAVDSLVIADVFAPADPKRRAYDRAAYVANVKAWVERGGNLVLTDRALHALVEMGIVPAGSVTDIRVYQPYSNFRDFSHPMLEGLRPNARQLAEATLVGYGIGNTASPMSIVTSSAWTAAGGHVVGTTGNGAGTSDNGAQTSVGELALGAGQIRIMGGGLPTPTETQDHRYGLKDYALTYSGLFILENSIVYDAANLGNPQKTPRALDLGPSMFLAMLAAGAVEGMRRRRKR